jgi:hypothetical protein
VKLFGPRRTLWTLAVLAGTALVVALLVLIGLGILIIPGVNATPTYTVESIHWTILQGKTETGLGWFGPSQFNSTGPPYPSTVTAGTRFQISVGLSNFDNVSHTIYSVTTPGPYAVSSVSPVTPINVPPSEDSTRLSITVTAPNQAGGSGILYLTIDTLG